MNDYHSVGQMLPVFAKLHRVTVQNLLEMCGVESNDRDVPRGMGV